MKTAIVAAFITREDGKILILKRSHLVGSNQGLWAAISGYLESEHPLLQVYCEIEEEAGISHKDLELLVEAPMLEFTNSETGIEWQVYHFLFNTKGYPEVTLNWENSDYAWIYPEEAEDFETTPNFLKSYGRLMDLYSKETS